ncbi:MAG: transposase zinc-binding domain-containing protein [Saprospiraceae bacterium]|nr:transposase zinc-binding domain-containing protein [Saprospiraceae bacterium]
MSADQNRPPQPVTLQNIILKYGSDYRSSHPLPYATHKVLNAVERCHTPALGAHVIRCQTPECGYEKLAYNSCRNRHCPGCQGSQSARWVGQRETELLRFYILGVRISWTILMCI